MGFLLVGLCAYAIFCLRGSCKHPVVVLQDDSRCPPGADVAMVTIRDIAHPSCTCLPGSRCNANVQVDSPPVSEDAHLDGGE